MKAKLGIRGAVAAVLAIGALLVPATSAQALPDRHTLCAQIEQEWRVAYETGQRDLELTAYVEWVVNHCYAGGGQEG